MPGQRQLRQTPVLGEAQVLAICQTSDSSAWLDFNARMSLYNSNFDPTLRFAVNTLLAVLIIAVLGYSYASFS